MLEQNEHERRVALGEVPHDQAVGQLREMSNTSFEGIEDAVLQFQKVDSYTTFSSEYSWVDGDLVVHFFVSPEVKAKGDKYKTEYWQSFFPRHLDATARRFFSADYPRLIAKYTEELESWWFKAHGYGHVLDPDAYAIRFLKTLDEDIERELTSSASP